MKDKIQIEMQLQKMEQNGVEFCKENEIISQITIQSFIFILCKDKQHISGAKTIDIIVFN